MLEDTFGHRISYLRISITDRCNERCAYCMPEEGQKWLPKEEVLSFEEIERICRIAAKLGVRKLRITGGEPLTRSGATQLIQKLVDIPGIDELGVSTNGTLLTRLDSSSKDTRKTYIQSLAAAGVGSVNISLDSLDPAVYASATGRDYHARAIAGIRAAREHGLAVKLNAVLMKNRSEGELIPLLNFAREENALLRFIELMPITDSNVLDDSRFLASGLAKSILELHTGQLEPRPDFKTNGPATYYQVPRTNQLIGFISALSDFHFCNTCNKLRLTCEGKLRPCLGSHLEIDLRDPLRQGADDKEIADLFHSTVARKPETHGFRDTYQPGRNMVAIGG